MQSSLKSVSSVESLISYFSEHLGWSIDLDDFDDIEDVTYDFDAKDLGLKEEAFAKISSLRQLRPLVDGQKWGIFFVEFDSERFEVTALRKILSGLIPTRRNSANHAVWSKEDLLFVCTWGGAKMTVGAAHFEDTGKGLPQINMISCEPAVEDFTQIASFEQKLEKLRWPANPSDADSWREQWSSAFSVRYRQVIQDSHTLTVRLAEEARAIRNLILDTLEVETDGGYVHQLLEKLRGTLVHDMSECDFADMYAQTIVYGLFSARCMDFTQDNFSAKEAIECLPNTNPFLKSLMKECFEPRVSRSALSFDELGVGNIVELLLHTKTDAIIADFNRQTGGGREDPVIHFYEEFLAEYDKSQKVQRGVYYTPQPVVNFMVKAVDDLLRSSFGLQDGFATMETRIIKRKAKQLTKNALRYRDVVETIEAPAVQVLDPATGTGTFLRQVILQAYADYNCAVGRSSEDDWSRYVASHLLDRLNGFEIMMAPYAVAHMKLALALGDTGYDFRGGRLNVFLTNSLEEPGDSMMQLGLWSDPIATESISANAVKKDPGINVVIGNPPYSKDSFNNGPWITRMMDDYKMEPGGKEKLKERNPKAINNDYVKFIRYAQEIVKRSGEGIVAFINPHGYLGDPTFRGMRWSLLDTFSEVYVLDLHGNSKRQETAPDGSADKNVFDIQQGVCINLFVKKKGYKGLARVYHADLYGLREAKYSFLSSNSLSSIEWQEIKPEPPHYYMLPKATEGKDEYESGVPVNKLMPLSSNGFYSARDHFAICDTREEAVGKINRFLSLGDEEARDAFGLGEDSRDWRVSFARKDLEDNAPFDNKLVEVCYRPFDHKWTFYSGKSKGFLCMPRADVMGHFANRSNVALITTRQVQQKVDFAHSFVTEFITDKTVLSGKDNASVFPLWVYSAGETLSGARRPNFDEKIASDFARRLGLTYSHDPESADRGRVLGAQDLFDYVYAVLSSPSYRSKYNAFLKEDYPRVPHPRNADLFWTLSDFGKQLRLLHTMTRLSHDDDSVTFPVSGSNLVESPAYKDGRVYINKMQYFSGVVPEAWILSIGGNQPALKWLKDRKGRALSSSEIEWYCKVSAVLNETVDVMNKISRVY